MGRFRRKKSGIVKSKVRNYSRWRTATEPYMVGTPTCDIVIRFLLDPLPRVMGATKKSLHIFNYGKFRGHIAPRKDRRGLLVFALYEKTGQIEKLQFRRRKDQYRWAQRPKFLTAPNVWASMNGVEGTLTSRDHREWSEQLLAAVAESDDTSKQFVFPYISDPNNSGESVSCEFWHRFDALRERRTKIEYKKRLYRVWRGLLARWVHIPSYARQRLPLPTKVSDTYLSKRYGISRSSIRRILQDLDELGYIQAVTCVPSKERGKRGIYCWLPGTGEPPKERTRGYPIHPRETIIRAYRYYKALCW